MQIIHLIGNLTKNPEIFGEATGRPKCVMNLAVNTQKRSPLDGKLHRVATYYRITVWGEQGRNCHRYLTKGRKVYFVGPLEVSLAMDKNGDLILDQHQKPIINLDVTADFVEFLSGAPATGGDAAIQNAGSIQASKPFESENKPLSVLPEELPF